MAMKIKTRESSLFDLGDPSAPVGSQPWTRAIYLHALAAVKSAQSSYDSLQTWIGGLIEDDHYRVLLDERGQAFQSWAGFCQAREPFGLGYSPDAIAALLRDRKAVETAQSRAQGARPLLPNGGDRRSDERIQSSNGILKQGNTADYLTARIARDRPDVLERMKAGEFKSVRQAAQAAGFASLATTVRLDDPASAARTLRKHASADFLRALVRELGEDQTAHR